MRTFLGVTSFWIEGDKKVRRMRLRMARDTARLAGCWPTICWERAATISVGVWCWWSLWSFFCFSFVDLVSTVDAVAVVSFSSSLEGDSVEGGSEVVMLLLVENDARRKLLDRGIVPFARRRDLFV